VVWSPSDILNNNVVYHTIDYALALLKVCNDNFAKYLTNIESDHKTETTEYVHSPILYLI